MELPTVTKEMTVPTMSKDKKVTFAENTKVADTNFDKSSATISNLVYKTWFSRYPCCQYLLYNNGSEFKLHLHSLCDTYGIKRKLTIVKNPHTNAILECIHAVFINMLSTTKLDMA